MESCRWAIRKARAQTPPAACGTDRKRCEIFPPASGQSRTCPGRWRTGKQHRAEATPMCLPSRSGSTTLREGVPAQWQELKNCAVVKSTSTQLRQIAQRRKQGASRPKAGTGAGSLASGDGASRARRTPAGHYVFPLWVPSRSVGRARSAVAISLRYAPIQPMRLIQAAAKFIGLSGMPRSRESNRCAILA